MRTRQAGFQANRDSLRRAMPELTDKFTSLVETDRLSAQFDLAAAALSGGLTHSVVIASPPGGRSIVSRSAGLASNAAFTASATAPNIKITSTT